MRFAAVLALALLAVPLAAADQAIVAGPLSVTTANATFGDGCDGVNGGASRDADATLDDPRGGGYKRAHLTSGCSRFDDGTNEFEGSYLSLYVTSVEANQQGPYAGYNWYGGETNGWSYCGSGAYVGGFSTPLGCPAPDGRAPPMLPELP